MYTIYKVYTFAIMGYGGDGKYVNGTGSDGKERAECFLNSVIHEKPRFVKRTRG